jgi:hypothetical protein
VGAQATDGTGVSAQEKGVEVVADDGDEDGDDDIYIYNKDKHS